MPTSTRAALTPILAMALAAALPALAAPAPPAASADDPFRGCATPQQGPNGWAVPCQGLVVGFDDGPGDGTCRTEACLQGLVQSFSGVIGATAAPRESKVTLAGRPRRVIRLDGTTDGKVVLVLMALVDRPEGRRVLNCLATPAEEARCRAAFERLAVLAWRAPAPASLVPASLRAFAGRPYAEPAGCTFQVDAAGAAGIVQCDDRSVFIWEEGADAAALEAKLAGPFMRLKLVERPAACAVDGVAATCRSFRPANGMNIGGDVARVALRGRTVVVACSSLDPAVTRPKACEGLVRLVAAPATR